MRQLSPKCETINHPPEPLTGSWTGVPEIYFAKGTVCHRSSFNPWCDVHGILFLKTSYVKYILPQARAARHRDGEGFVPDWCWQGVQRPGSAQLRNRNSNLCQLFVWHSQRVFESGAEKKFMTRRLPPGFHDLSSTSNSMCRNFLPKVNARNDAPNPKKASE